jgi:putative transcriptional regulator
MNTKIKKTDAGDSRNNKTGAQAARTRFVTYESDALAAVHEMATDLHEAGVMKASTMRHFDELCLTPVHELAPDEIREIRERSGVSQAVMARVVNVTTSTVGQWERGEKRPAGTSLKLLSLARAHGLESIY